jgi:hypothetical protein
MLGAVHELGDQMDGLPGTSFTFYGDGLVQWCASRYIPRVWELGHVPVLAIQKIPKTIPEEHGSIHTKLKFMPAEPAFLERIDGSVISPEYRALNHQLHQEQKEFGNRGAVHMPNIRRLVEEFKFHSVLDYGCGKGRLAQALPFPIQEYDPAIPGKEAKPEPAEFVVCTDVLEHIEPNLLSNVLRDLQRCTKTMGYFVISTGPAKRELPDGRNAHLLQKDAQWWKTQLEPFFTIDATLFVSPLFHVIVSAKDRPQPYKIPILVEE